MRCRSFRSSPVWLRCAPFIPTTIRTTVESITLPAPVQLPPVQQKQALKQMPRQRPAHFPSAPIAASSRISRLLPNRLASNGRTKQVCHTEYFNVRRTSSRPPKSPPVLHPRPCRRFAWQSAVPARMSPRQSIPILWVKRVSSSTSEKSSRANQHSDNKPDVIPASTSQAAA